MSSLQISDRLIRNLSSRKCTDEALAMAYETGEARTIKASTGVQKAVGRRVSEFISRIKPKACTSPDKSKSIDRKRTWGGDGSVPDFIRGNYSDGERAVLAVVVTEVKKRGFCDWAIDRIAAVAGVSRTTCQNAMRKAAWRKNEDGEDDPHVSIEYRPRPGRKNLTNIIRIISRAWIEWINLSIGFKKMNPTKRSRGKTSLSLQVSTSQEALEGDERAVQLPELDLAQPARSWLHRYRRGEHQLPFRIGVDPVRIGSG